MRTILVIILFSISTYAVHAQETIIQTYYNSNYANNPNKKVEGFEYIAAEVVLSEETKVASYHLTIDIQGKNNLGKSFYDLWTVANKVGANAFAIDSVRIEGESYITDISVYYLDEYKMQENFSFYEPNIIVILGDLNTENLQKNKSCKVNKEKVEIAPYSYILYRLEEGEAMKISVGSFIGGSALTLEGRPNQLGRCYSLSGTTLLPAGGGVTIGNRYSGMGVGVTISTGSIYPVDLNFGLFAMTILDSAPIVEE